MKLKIATFALQHSDAEEYSVTFMKNAVHIHRNGLRIQEVDNTGNRWKPCVTHCLDLIKLANNKPPSRKRPAPAAAETPKPAATKRTLKVFSDCE